MSAKTQHGADVKIAIAQKKQRLTQQYHQQLKELEAMELKEKSLMKIKTADHGEQEKQVIQREIALQVSKAFNAMEEEARLKETVRRKYEGYIQSRVKELITSEIEELMYKEKMESVSDHRQHQHTSRGGRNKQYRDGYYKLPKYPKRGVNQHGSGGHDSKINQTSQY